MTDSPNLKLTFGLVDKLAYREVKAFQKDASWEPTPIPKQARGQIQWAVASAGNIKVAIARLELARPHFCFITSLVVLSPYRRGGVGSWLLTRLEQHARAQGIPRLILEPAAGTQDYYRAHYFIEDPLVPTCMKKEISPLLHRRFVP
jgi:GNAT superfamily N-acetyltransferase